MSELKVLGVALAGAAIGVAIGASFGLATFPALAAAGSIGFSIGTLVGQQLFPEQIKQEGSRLNDLAVSSSAFGAVRPIVYGQVRIGGNVIWSKPIREQKTTTKHGKGGSGPSVTNTSYSYHGSFALALCEGPVETVLRIWADSKLIYDVTGEQNQHTQAEGLKFRFYPGDEEQLPDSIIQADKGAENVPAYRGTCYIVFDDIPLADYGNRLPNITCEVVTRLSPAYPYQVWTQSQPTIFGEDSVGNGAMAVDWDRNLIYSQGQNPFGLAVIDAVSLRTIREVPMTDVLADHTDGTYPITTLAPNILVGGDGALYWIAYPQGLIRVDQNTLKQTNLADSSVGYTLHTATMNSFTSGGQRDDYIVGIDYFGKWRVWSIPELELQDSASNDFSGLAVTVASGKWGLGFSEAWALWGPGVLGGPHMYISRIKMNEGGLVDDAMVLLGFSGKFSSDLMATFTANLIDPDNPTAAFVPQFTSILVYDESDDSLVICFGTAVGIGSQQKYWAIKWSETSGIVWKTQLPIPPHAISVPDPSSPFSSQSRITQGTLAWFSVGGLTQIDTATGRLLVSQAATSAGDGWPIGVLNSIQIYDSETQIVLGSFNNNIGGVSVPGDTAKAFIGRRTAEAVPLETIVSDQFIRAGFDLAEFDADTLTDLIDGFVISQPASVAGVLTPLMGAYLVEAVESDYTMRFFHRGGAIVADLVQDDMIRPDQQSAEPYVETRQQEIELPMRLTITYTDKDRDYQQNTAAAKRIRNPDPTVFSDNQVDLQFATVMTATPAKQMAETLLYTTWNERHTIAARLSPEFDYLDPGDVVQVTLNDGYTARMRLGAITLGVDYSLETKLVGETDGQYVSLAEADPGVPWIGSSYIRAAGKSKLLLLDIPLLRDIDDTGGLAIRGYYGGGPYDRSTAWPGAVLQENVSTLWTTITAVADEMTWGYIETPPADWPPVFATQSELQGGSMVVGIIGGDFIPSSITDEGMANFLNPIVLIKPNGQVEIVQYRDATSMADGRWRLSTLRRGQRGTDTMAFGHVSGEIVAFLDESLIDAMVVPLEQRNVNEFWRLVTVGQIPDNANAEPFVFHGRDMMPYAPVHAKATLVSTNLVLTWIPRTRMGGMMVDGSDLIPLHETTEAYEAYLLETEADAENFDPANPATYVRAFTGLSSPTLTYTAAMMSTDGFNPMTEPLYAAIYQISGVVGRGFSSLHVIAPFGALTVGLEDGTGDWAGWTWG